jgi:hypothetical protein
MARIGKSIGTFNEVAYLESTTTYASEFHTQFSVHYDINTKRVGLIPYFWLVTNHTADVASRIGLANTFTINIYAEADAYQENPIATYSFDSTITAGGWRQESLSEYHYTWDLSSDAYSGCWGWFDDRYGTGFAYENAYTYKIIGLEDESNPVLENGLLYLPSAIEDVKKSMITDIYANTFTNANPTPSIEMTIQNGYRWFDKVEVALTANQDGKNVIVDYTTITGSLNAYNEVAYTFDTLTTEQMAIILNYIYGNTDYAVIYYQIRGTFVDGTVYNYTPKKSYCYMTQSDIEIDPTVYDANEKTVALTGDQNTLIKYHSDVVCQLNATGSYTDAKVVNNGITHNFTMSHVGIGNVEANTFQFSCKSGVSGSIIAKSITKPMIPYVKLTCNVVEMIGPDAESGNITFSVKGNYYYGSFGAQTNSITVKCLYKTADAQEWTVATVPAKAIWTYENNTWKASYAVEGMDYTKSYYVQINVSDKLESVTTPAEKAIAKPVFDWSKNDFNVNVPMTIMKMPIGQNTVLWQSSGNTTLAEGAWYYLNKNISTAASGIVLVFSSPQQSSYYITHFIPKFIALLDETDGAVVGVPLQADTGWSGSAGNAIIQYVRFLDNRFAGAGACVNGSNILQDNSGYYLRYVIAV